MEDGLEQMAKSEQIEANIQQIVGNKYSILLRNSFVQLAPIMTVLGIGLFIYAFLMRFIPEQMGVWTDISTQVFSLMCIGISFLIIKMMVGEMQENNHESGLVSMLYLLLFIVRYSMQNPNVTLLQVGATSILPALFLGLSYGCIYRLLLRRTLRNPFPSSVPQAVINVVNTTWQHAVIFLSTLFIVLFIPVYEWLVTLTMMCLAIFNQPLVMGIIISVICLFWLKGIHGVTVIGLFLRPFWLQMLVLNGAAYLTQQPLPYIIHESFFQWIVWIGGSGATIGLAICLKLFSRSERFKELAKSGTVATFFNINETVIYGMPISNNRYLVIPFILSPLVNGLLGYWFIAQGFLDNIILTVPWVFPAPIGLFFATGGDIRAILVSALLIFISIVIYFPFFIQLDKQEQLKDQKE